jgi:hypothetical protein
MSCGGDHGLGDQILEAYAAVLACGQTVGGTGRCLIGVVDHLMSGSHTLGLMTNETGLGGRAGTLLPLVTQCGNDLLVLQGLAAHDAKTACGQTVGGAGRCLMGKGLGGMTLGSYVFLRNDHSLADITMNTLRHTGIGTGSRDCHVNDLDVPLCGNGILRYQHFMTNRAVTSLGQTVFGTGRLYCLINDFDVPLSRDHHLSLQYLIADAAVTTLCQTGGGTGRLMPLIRNGGMSRGFNRGLRNKHCVAASAMRALG